MDDNILTIIRATWRRGGGNAFVTDRLGLTRLLNDMGLMCCLGSDAVACGIPKEKLLNKVDPEGLVYQAGGDIPAEYINTRLNDGFCNVPAVQQAMEANDDPDITEEERETKVRAALMELGWDDVVFVD